MKITREEFGHEYGEGIYRFGYCEYATLEKNDQLADFYAKGFLPHSANPKIVGDFYMARGARVPLKEFALTSENRRIAKRFDNTLTIREMPAKGMPEDIKKLFIDYFAKRHGKNTMPKERLEAVLSWPVPLSLIIYENNAVPLAAVLEVSDGAFGHFWYSAYDLALTEQSLGMWLMLDGARRARGKGLSHYYLGTVYGGKALYKANLTPLEFWDGSSWDSDITLLKKLARSESR
jgi:hypothetical protein